MKIIKLKWGGWLGESHVGFVFVFWRLKFTDLPFTDLPVINILICQSASLPVCQS
jgi:hypothetical protein